MLGRAVVALSALIVLGGGACGGDSEDAKTAAGGDRKNPPFEARVEITKDGYRPQHVRILVGGSVTFVNVDKTQLHTAETDDLPDRATDNNEFDTHSLTWEEPYTVVFHKPETVEYHDSFNDDMTGTVEAVAKR